MLDAQNSPPTYGVTPTVAREQFRRLTAEMPATAVGDVADFAIEGPDGDLPIRAYVPEGEGPFPVLVYYHGGGWVIGGLDEYENVTSAICDRAEVVVLSVDYRLAPEHPFPAQLEDAYAAADWASEFAEHVSGDPDRVAVGGDSAGGNLAAAVSLLARDRDGPELAAPTSPTSRSSTRRSRRRFSTTSTPTRRTRRATSSSERASTGSTSGGSRASSTRATSTRRRSWRVTSPGSPRRPW